MELIGIPEHSTIGPNRNGDQNGIDNYGHYHWQLKESSHEGKHLLTVMRGEESFSLIQK